MPANHECGRILWQGETPYAVCTAAKHSVHSHVEYTPWESVHQGTARPFALEDFETKHVELMRHAMR